MADNSVVADSNKKNSFPIKIISGQQLNVGAIVEVLDLEQAKIAEEDGAFAVVVSGSAGMPHHSLIQEIMAAVSIPVMAKCRVGHFAEAQFLEALGVACIDENELLVPSDNDNHINKHDFSVPFCCGCRNLGEALTRVNEGAALIRIQGGASDDHIANKADTIQNVRLVRDDIKNLSKMDSNEVYHYAHEVCVPIALAKHTKKLGRLPVLQFAAGGIVTPDDASLMMQYGCDGVFVGSEIFGFSDSFKRLPSIVKVVDNYNDPNSWGS